MTINSKLIKYDASCSTFGDWAIKNKLNISKSNTPKRGDIVLFDFNHNGTSDHVGIVTGANGNTVYTVEGNTSITSNDNGGCVMKRSRTKSQINYFVRPKYTEEVTAEMVVQTALDEVGTKESPSGSNKCKYNTWYYGREVRGSAYPWCMVFVSWVYAHVKESESKEYTGTHPDLTLHSRQLIGTTAKKLAYAKGTTKATYTYPKGKAKAIFTKAIDKVYPNRKGWSKQCQAGASCDVGAGTIIRYCGYDSTIPRGLAEQIPHLKKSSLWEKTSLKQTKDMAFGDVGVYSGNGGHIWISLGGSLIAEANHTAKYFEHIVSKNIKKGNHTYYAIFRACKPSEIKQGSEGTEVTKLQNFLNWAGFDCGKADGSFGENTLKALVSFQNAVGIKADGVAGEGTLKKMKEYTR